MSENIITDAKSARALVKFERDRSKVVYADYIAANGVTLETVSAHVAALAALAFPKFDNSTADDESKAERKGFMNRVRNGLNYRLGKSSAKQETAEPQDGAGEAEDGAESADSAPAIPTTADLVSVAEDTVRALIVRALAGDTDAMAGLNTLSAAIDVAGAEHADTRIAA